MATRKDATTKLAVQVILSRDGEKEKYGQRVFMHINPELSDEDVLSIGTKLGALQSYEVKTVNRTDAAGLGE